MTNAARKRTENKAKVAQILSRNEPWCPLHGVKVSVSGYHERSRSKIAKYFCAVGGELCDRVTKDVDILIADDGPENGKVKIANWLKKPVISMEDFIEIVVEGVEGNVQAS